MAEPRSPGYRDGQAAQRLTNAEDDIRDLKEDQKKIDKRVQNLELWRSFVLGAATLIAFIVGAMTGLVTGIRGFQVGH